MSERFDMEEQLKLKLWAGEYYSEGRPIVRLLSELAISAFKGEESDE